MAAGSASYMVGELVSLMASIVVDETAASLVFSMAA